MPERSSKNKQPRDLNQLPAGIVGGATEGESEDIEVGRDPDAPEKNPHAAALGRLGGKKGGPARAVKLSAARRSEIARKAAQARWRGANDSEQGG